MTTPWKTTACILCECNCGLEVQLGGEGDSHFTLLRGDDRHPTSRGYACEKAHRLDHYQHARDRVKQPLRRKPDGTFEEIDWATAIREVAAKLAAVRDQFGGDTIFYYGGGGQGNHLPGSYATATRRALGSRYGRARSRRKRRASSGSAIACSGPSPGPTSSTAKSASSSARIRGIRTRFRARA